MKFSDYIDSYCERLEPGLLAEPVNLFSNLTFIIAGFVLAQHSRSMQARGVNLPFSIKIFPYLVIIVGIGSGLFHSFANFGTMLMDIIPIAVTVFFGLFSILFYLHGRNWWQIALGFVLLFVISWLISLVVDPELVNHSQSYFGVCLMLIALGFTTPVRFVDARKYLLLSGCVFIVSLVFRSIDLPLCDSFPLGTHFMWHLLNGVTLWSVGRGLLCFNQRV